MNLCLGFFENFKSEDSILLAGEPSDIELLSSRLGSFVDSQESSLLINNLAWVSPSHPVQLSVHRSNPGSPSQQASQFGWLCSVDAYPTIRGKLQALIESGSGHHYFNLIGSQARLVVSVGEYGKSWWQEHG